MKTSSVVIFAGLLLIPKRIYEQDTDLATATVSPGFFESMAEAAHFIDGVKLDERVREDVCCNSAVRLLGLRRN